MQPTDLTDQMNEADRQHRQDDRQCPLGQAGAGEHRNGQEHGQADAVGGQVQPMAGLVPLPDRRGQVGSRMCLPRADRVVDDREVEAGIHVERVVPPDGHGFDQVERLISADADALVADESQCRRRRRGEQRDGAGGGEDIRGSS